MIKYLQSKKKIVSKTAQIDFISGSHFADVKKECYALKQVLQRLVEEKADKSHFGSNSWVWFLW